MKCTKCKTEATVMISVYKNDQLHSLCDRCLVKMQPNINSILEIDEKIVETQDLIRGIENIIRNSIEPDLSKLDESISALAFTPSKLLLFIKTILTDLLKQKMNLLNTMGEKEKVTYKLKEAIRVEDYKIAIELRDTLNKLYGSQPGTD